MHADANRIGNARSAEVRETPHSRPAAAANASTLPLLCDAAVPPIPPRGHATPPGARRRLPAWGVLVIAAALMGLVGCRSGTSAPLGLETPAANYDAAFDATLRALRSEGYQIERVDRRFGVITTRPRTTPTAFEPWRGWGNPVDVAVEGTVHHQQRTIRVAFQPLDPADAPAADAAGSDAQPTDDGARSDADEPPANAIANATPDNDVDPSARQPLALESSTRITPTATNPWPFQPARHSGLLRVEVTATVEREQIAGRRIETTSVRHSSISADPRWRERGIGVRSWNAIARDPWLEREIMEVLERTGGPDLFQPIGSAPTQAHLEVGRPR